MQEKDDPHDHAVFVANLPLSLAQRQYERILLRLLGAKGCHLFVVGTFVLLRVTFFFVFRSEYKMLYLSIFLYLKNATEV